MSKHGEGYKTTREEAENLASEMCEECKGRCFEEDRYNCSGYKKEVEEILEQENKLIEENEERGKCG